MAEVQWVESNDGTRIAYAKSGTGPALILIGGALADHRFYDPLVSELTPHFTVYNMDRRGHGQSEDTAPYSVEREIEDLNALITKAGEAVCLYGHSAGSALALRAAAAGLKITRLVLADPPYTARGEHDADASAQFAEETAHIAARVTSGDYRGSARLFLGGFGLPDEAVEQMLASPEGVGMIHNARALPYDYAVLGDGLVPVELAARVDIPTLVLASEDVMESSQMLARAIPNGRLQLLDAPTHALAPVLIHFFKEN